MKQITSKNAGLQLDQDMKALKLKEQKNCIQNYNNL